jgi:hypothetical protein
MKVQVLSHRSSQSSAEHNEPPGSFKDRARGSIARFCLSEHHATAIMPPARGERWRNQALSITPIMKMTQPSTVALSFGSSGGHGI